MIYQTGKLETLFAYRSDMWPQFANSGKSIMISGMVQSHRNMGEVTFVNLRLHDRLLQCVLDRSTTVQGADQIRDESGVRMHGKMVVDQRAPGGFEFHVTTAEIISQAHSPRPIHLGKKINSLSLEADLAHRPISLRHQHHRSMFRLQEGICRGFRDYLHSQGFTEIHSPKIVAAGAEGGSNIFRLDYFGRKAFLTQSPQFYKQMMVGVFERVFEVGPVFRAEKHSTVRHLNEYTSLDFEMGFINSFEDIMAVETAMLSFMLELLKKDYMPDLELLNVQLPDADRIPQVRFDEAKQMVASKYDRRIRDPFDLEPEEERLIGELFKQEFNSDFVFVTHYPSKKRPFYALDDPDDSRYTLSFDLLFRGLEVTTGGQRIHSYDEQVGKMLSKGMDPAEFEDYLMIHKYGMPPHGGLGIGLERLLMMLTGQPNVRQAVLFPRDQSRLAP
jgi:nondiscriminating aspartyl-tRNA synthetase